MSTPAKRVLGEALDLSPAERASVAEELLSSLDKPDQEIDEIWAQEAEARIGAVERGGMQTVSEEEVFAKYDRR